MYTNFDRLNLIPLRDMGFRLFEMAFGYEMVIYL